MIGVKKRDWHRREKESPYKIAGIIWTILFWFGALRTKQMITSGLNNSEYTPKYDETLWIRYSRKYVRLFVMSHRNRTWNYIRDCSKQNVHIYKDITKCLIWNMFSKSDNVFWIMHSVAWKISQTQHTPPQWEKLKRRLTSHIWLQIYKG